MIMRKLPLFLLLFFFWLKLASSLSPDCLPLLSLKSAVYNSQALSSTFSDWNENDTTPCNWSGVYCTNITGSPETRVVGISLPGKNLRAYIPSELGTLIYLRKLSLRNNRFFGSIPDQLFDATTLRSLFLYGNNLSGPLPPSICNVSVLQNVDLSGNSLSGSLLENLKDCKQLRKLVLARNKFSGEIPDGIWPGLNNLVQLDLSSNEFNGSIPGNIGKLKSLSGTLNLSYNRLSGKLPISLGDLPVTVGFDLRNNNIRGEIPGKGSFANQGPTAFLNNPLLCGFPLQKSCENPILSPSGSQNSGPKSGGTEKKELSHGLIVLISVANAAGVVFVGLIIVYIYWKRKDSSNSCSCTGETKFGRKGKGKLCSFTSLACTDRFRKEDSEFEDHERVEGKLVAIDKSFTFELDELLRASAYVLGKSGLGIVYKVVLGNGVPVVVRRLGEGGEQRYKEFVADVQSIGKVKHPNIVRLRAYYWAPGEKLLISDFIPNGNLANAIRGRNGQSTTILSWSIRLKIAKGAAGGLAYLHECSPRIFVHGDVKPSNVHLDNDYGPYISDFGLNRLITITSTNPSSAGGFIGGLSYKSIRTEGTNDHRAPEARAPGDRPTQKWDVYSFGVIVLELLTGKSPELSSTTTTSVKVPDLVKWLRKGFDEGIPLSDMIDPMLAEEVQAKEEMLAVFHVALACTEVDAEVRPRMKTGSENLERIGT
ncbi:receptor protein kinase-like protein ZAR1 [Hibiscus syriacus]|uniref:receptor protein kinase-like protein ZAR1 n=1 Tax=Hibiscus syriacus TaxID=106335 RepID=UPI001923DD50|nr:receptor protein kinase-like protein ZAR1 [Hibiscus syriacus]